MNKYLKKIFSIIIVCFLTFSLFVQISYSDEKEFFDGTIDDITVDDKVWVTILHEHSGLDKEFSQEDFRGIEIVDITYVTSLKDPNKEYPYLDKSEYSQILVLTLKNPGKENVLEAIRILEENEIVKSALPYPEPDEVGDMNESIIGDVNFDSICNAEDALVTLKVAAKILETDSIQREMMDINFDQNIDSVDALWILKISAKLI